MKIHISLHNNKDANWVQLLEDLYAQLGFPNNPNLLPPQFAQVVFPKIGGQLALVKEKEQLISAGFLFPHKYDSDQRIYLFFYPPVVKQETEQAFDPAELIPLLQSQLNGARVHLFDPNAPSTYGSSNDALSHTILPSSIDSSITIDRPTEAEAEEIRMVHQQIWGSPPGYLYPVETHSIEFGPGTSLIARVTGRKEDNQVVGFLHGFRRFGGSHLPADWHERLLGDWRIESQSMGILPEFRGRRLGYHLKQRQAKLARSQGINIINWTADPLQFRNAALNFGLLRAIAFDFHADLYPFRNDLNRVAASRFSLTWLINADRVREMEDQCTQIIDLSTRNSSGNNSSDINNIVRINDGTKQLVTETDAAQIAIEIPADWSEIQSQNLDEAQAWRLATDTIFAQLIGCEQGQYIITDVAVDGPRCYLIGCRSSDSLLRQLRETSSKT